MSSVRLQFCAHTRSTAVLTCVCSIIITILIVITAGAPAIFGKYLPGMQLVAFRWEQLACDYFSLRKDNPSHETWS
jgi:hypothetical protein